MKLYNLLIVNKKHYVEEEGTVCSPQVLHSAHQHNSPLTIIKDNIKDTANKYQTTLVCPHCKLKNEYIFPLNFNLDNPKGKIEALQPIVYFCGKCHKRLIISTLDLAGIKNDYEKYKNEIIKMQESAKPVILAPVLDHYSIEIHQVYGIDIKKLNVKFYMDERNFPEGAFFLNYPVFLLSDQNIKRYCQFVYIILPCENYSKIKKKLNENGVEEKDIIFLEL